MRVIVIQGYSGVKCWCVVDAFNHLGHEATLVGKDEYYALSDDAADLVVDF